MASNQARQPGCIDTELRAQIEAAADGDWPDPEAMTQARYRFIERVWDSPAESILSEDELSLIRDNFDLDEDALTLNDVCELLSALNDRAVSKHAAD